MERQTIYTLIVKGNKYQAARAAADRGIPAVFLREVETDTVLATRADIDTLNRWICEDTVAPFPIGSLLLWSEHPDTTLSELRNV